MDLLHPPYVSSPRFSNRSRYCFFFFNDTATTEIYTLSLHDALPISGGPASGWPPGASAPSPSSARAAHAPCGARRGDRKSTRLNSSHDQISYAVFCLKKKNDKLQALDTTPGCQYYTLVLLGLCYPHE